MEVKCFHELMSIKHCFLWLFKSDSKIEGGKGAEIFHMYHSSPVGIASCAGAGMWAEIRLRN